MGLFDLEKQFAFYGAYHSNPINVAIHMIFVWPILFTILVLLHFTPPLLDWNLGFLVLNVGFLVSAIYAAYYVRLDRKAGSLAAFLVLLCWVGSSALGHTLGFSLAWKVILPFQLISWVAQFIGHGTFEKRAPAFLDDPLQAPLMAPYFVLLEALQSGVGYEPYPGFNAKVKGIVEADVNAWKNSKLKKVS